MYHDSFGMMYSITVSLEFPKREIMKYLTIQCKFWWF